jgi:selenocysteine lyase/cysteine desulfurase
MTPEVRAQFPITKRYNYLNHAAVSPLPTTTVQAVESQLRDVRENGSAGFATGSLQKNKLASSWHSTRRTAGTGRFHA